MAPAGRTARLRHPVLLLCAAFGLAFSAQFSAAQESTTGFRLGFGWQEPGGDLGNALDGNVDAEFTVLVPVRFLQVGAGANWASFDVSDADASWSQVRFHALVGYPFRLSERVHPYVEGRWTYRHLRPEDDRYFGGEDKVLRDFKASGGGLELVAGMALFVNPRVALDLSGGIGTYDFTPDLSEEGFGALDSGTAWRAQLGVAWFPLYSR